MTLYLETVKTLHSKAEYLFAGVPCGASPLEIADLCRSLEFELPAAYEEFLRWMGRRDGGAFPGWKSSIDDLTTNAVSLQEVLESNDLHSVISEQKLVFMGNESYRYAWFYLPSESDDPTVHSLTLDQEVSRESIAEHSSLSGFLLDELKEIVLSLLESTADARGSPGSDLVPVTSFGTLAEALLAVHLLAKDGITAYCGGQHAAELGLGVFAQVMIEVADVDLSKAVEILKNLKPE